VNVKELKEKKEKAEKEILKIVEQLEKETGIKVKGIAYHYIYEKEVELLIEL